MWKVFVKRLLQFCAACPFLVVGWIGVSLAANPQRYDEPPDRYKAELEDFDRSLREDVSPFQRGPLMGWYVYVVVGEERVVCANPKVWDGPKVISCTHVVAIDDDVPTAEGGAPNAKLIPSIPAFVPDYGDEATEELRARIDLIRRRLTWDGRNDTR